MIDPEEEEGHDPDLPESPPLPSAIGTILATTLKAVGVEPCPNHAVPAASPAAGAEDDWTLIVQTAERAHRGILPSFVMYRLRRLVEGLGILPVKAAVLTVETARNRGQKIRSWVQFVEAVATSPETRPAETVEEKADRFEREWKAREVARKAREVLE